jgi:DNA-binding CsgD family transcriptional regulator
MMRDTGRSLGAFAVKLRAVRELGELAALTLAEVKRMFSAAGVALELHRDGRPILCVATDWFDVVVLNRYLESEYRRDPCLAQVRETLVPLVISDVLPPRGARELAAAYGCPDASTLHTTLAPLVGDSEMLGVLRVAFERRLSATMREDLGLIAGHISVRLAHLGFSRTGANDPLAALTGRQRQVAHMVAQGMRNAEIAADLGLSLDAIKKHVKLALDALDLANRAELAAVVTRAERSSEPESCRLDLPGLHVVRRARPASEPP